MINNALEFPDGTYTVLVTPFCSDDTIDVASLDRLLKYQYSHSAVGLVLLGTTSEGPTLDFDESVRLVQCVYNYNRDQPNKKFLVAGIGGNCTRNVLKLAAKVADYCDAFMVTVPNYNRPQQRGVIDLFQQVSRDFPHKPVMIYNIPGRTGLDMEPDSMIEVLRKCPNVTALKEASGNYVNVDKLVKLVEDSGIRNLNKTFKIFSGDDANVVKLCQNYKGRGLISVASNVIPREITEIVNACIVGDFDRASDLMNNSAEFIKYLFIESNPVPVKEMLYIMGLCDTNKMRRPLMEMNDRDKINTLKILFKNLTNISSDTLR